VTSPPEPPDLAALEHAVQRALASGSTAGLHVLGQGEISLVLGHPAGAPTSACKRLPRFPDPESFSRYGEVLAGYLDALSARGLRPAPSALHRVPGDGGVVGYVVQPLLPAERVAPEVLRQAPPDPEHPVVAQVVEHVVAAVDDRVGVDAQLSNWVVEASGRLTYLDVTTPLLRRPDGSTELDIDLFLAPFPWAIRGAVRRFVVPGLLARYHDPRSVLLDVAANLLKERLDPWLPAVVAAANRHLSGPAGAPLSVEEVRHDYASDARQWEVLLRLRRADRWWQRTVRRRTYPFLLPGRIAR